MSDSATNRGAALQAADEAPMSIGRGTGMTIRELNKRINVYMRRKNMPSLKWRTKAECDAIRNRRARPIRLVRPCRLVRVRRLDLFYQL